MQKFTKNSLTKIGAETERTSKHNRNKDIDAERTPLNLYFKKTENGFMMGKSEYIRLPDYDDLQNKSEKPDMAE